MRTILTTSCDDGFTDWLCAMLESLQDSLDQHALGVCDLGLTEQSKNRIRKIKPDTIFEKAKWFIEVPEHEKKIPYLAFSNRPFANEIFPNFDAYVHVDADIWFADASGLEDMIKAGQKHGIACVYERKNVLTRRKKLFGLTVYKKREPIVYADFERLYGQEEAERLTNKTMRRMNGGFSYIKGDHHFWKLYQDAMRKAVKHGLEHNKSGLFCDQTAFLYTLLDSNIPHEALPYTHNCVEKKLTFDKSTGDLYYPYCPDEPVKVMHLTASKKDRIRKLKTTDGGFIETSLTYHAIKKLKENL